MAPSFFAAGTQLATNTDGASIAPALPANTAADDISFALAMTNANNVPTISAGWTAVTNGAKADANMSSKLWWRRETGAGGSAPTITDDLGTALSNSNGLFGRVYVWRGCVTTGDPFEDPTLNFNTTLSAQPLTSEVTTTGADRRVVNFCSIDDDTAWNTAPPPASWVLEVADSTSTTGGDDRLSVIGIDIASAQTVASVQHGLISSGEWFSNVTLALLPVVAGPPPERLMERSRRADQRGSRRQRALFL